MWDFLSQILQSLQLHHYNTRVVVSGVTVFGATAGVIGAFMLLRKRSLTGDALSHATLPGVCLAFMLSVQLGGTGKSLPVLLSGAMISGLSGLGVMLFLRHWTRLREDSILGIVLSVFFGLGVVLQGMAVNMKQGQAAGLSSFIYGRTASMLAADAWLIVVGALVASLICALLFKELTLLCFDQDFAGAQGWPVLFLDSLLMFLVAVVTVIGLQAVGLVLVVAMLITPAAAARFWTDRLAWMVWGSALIGAASGLVGALASAMVPRLPAGAVIVLIASAMFAISLVFGAKRGLIVRLLQRRHLHTTSTVANTFSGPCLSCANMVTKQSHWNHWSRSAAGPRVPFAMPWPVPSALAMCGRLATSGVSPRQAACRPIGLCAIIASGRSTS